MAMCGHNLGHYQLYSVRFINFRHLGSFFSVVEPANTLESARLELILRRFYI